MVRESGVSLDYFSRQIGRKLLFERVQTGRTVYWRCFFLNTLFLDQGSATELTVIGGGINKQRARQDFTNKIRGKTARVVHCFGRREEFTVPTTLVA